MRERTEASAEAPAEAPAEASAEASAESSLSPTDREGAAIASEHAAQGCPTAETSEEGMTQLQSAAHEFLHDCDRCARYHTERRAFLDTWHRWMMVGVLLSGSAAVAALSKAFVLSSGWTIALMLIPTVVGAVNAAWNLTHKARDHEILARRWHDLACRINITQASEQAVEEWRVGEHAILADEPPTFYALNAACHNAVCQARGSGREHMQRIRWWHRALRHWLRFSPETFPRYADIPT